MTPLNQNGISRLRLTPGAALCLSIVAVAILSTASSAEKADHDNHEGHGRDELAQKHDDHAEHDDHEEHEAAAEHDDHEEHDDHGHEAHADHEEEGLRLTAEQRKRFRIKAQPAAPGSLRSEISLPGEIIFNGDLVVHMVPRVAGIVRKVNKTVGDSVKTGEILAVIDSRELADAKAEYLAADARRALAEKTFRREKQLRDKQVSSEQDFLEAEQAFAEANIEMRSAKQKLYALGLSVPAINSLEEEQGEAITRYEIRSPIDGVVTEKHLSLGESLEADADILTVVDMSSVWVNLSVHTKNLAAVKKGQDATLRIDHSGAQARGRIAMVTPFVEAATRSATARVVLDNADGRLIPGTFVTGLISLTEENVGIVIPRKAVQVVEGRSVVFVEHEGEFEMTQVKTGRSDRRNVEILGGLEVGDTYVAEGAFELKATVVTSSLDAHAGHGH